MINANAPVVVAEIGRSTLPVVSNLEVHVSTISISSMGNCYLLVANFAALPLVGDSTILYITDDTELFYRWDTSTLAYITVGSAQDLSAYALLTDLAAYAPALTEDENYVTDAEKTILANTSGANTGDQDLSSYALASDLLATKYSPTSITIVAGTLASGDVTSLYTPDDSNILRVNETGDGLTLEFEYHDIVEFTTITERLQYVGGASHVLQRLYYNWLTSTWDVIGEFTGTQAGLTWMTVGTPESSAYVGTGANLGVVKTRRHHVAPFNTSHYLLFDYAGAISSVGGVAVGGPTQAQAEDLASDSSTLYSWSIRRLKQFITTWWTTISGSVLPTTATIYATQTGNFTILADMAGKTVPVSTTATATLPSWNSTGFGNGFQCVILNTSATTTDITLSGTVVAVGTKINQKKAAVLSISGDTWRATGGLTT